MHMGGPDALRHRPIVTTKARYRAAQMDYFVGSTDLAARPAALTMKPCRRTSLGGSGRHDHAFLGRRELARPPSALHLPLHADLVLMAQRRRGLLRQTVDAF